MTFSEITLLLPFSFCFISFDYLVFRDITDFDIMRYSKISKKQTQVTIWTVTVLESWLHRSKAIHLTVFSVDGVHQKNLLILESQNLWRLPWGPNPQWKCENVIIKRAQVRGTLPVMLLPVFKGNSHSGNAPDTRQISPCFFVNSWTQTYLSLNCRYFWAPKAAGAQLRPHFDGHKCTVCHAFIHLLQWVYT